MSIRRSLLVIILALPGVVPLFASAQVFVAPEALNTNAATDSGWDKHQQVATDGAGVWLVVWETNENLGGSIGFDRDILVSRSTDAGVTWTHPVPLNTNAAVDIGGDFSPQVSTDGAGRWVAVWESRESLGGAIGTDLDILVSRSEDAGATWTAPMPLNTNAALDIGGDYSPQVSTDGAGNWLAVWSSTEDLDGILALDPDLLVSRSTDAGANWTAPAPLNTNAVTDIGGDYDPTVSTDGSGLWVAVWPSGESFSGTIGSDLDLLISRSMDNGLTWTAPHPLNSDAATDGGADFEPDVTNDGAGSWVAVWASSKDLGGTIGPDGDILVSRSTDAGVTWTHPVPLNTNAAVDIGGDYSPQVSTDGAGRWVAVWHSDEDLGATIGMDGDLLISRSIDGGSTWMAPDLLNRNATTDSGHDISAQVTTDGAGSWVAVWSSWEDLGGAIGPDSDIFFATAFEPIVVPQDIDGDLVEDSVDNCSSTANASQFDTDGDQFGNACDCDFNNDGFCSIADFNLFLPDFVTSTDSGKGTDMDGDGVVGISDFNLFLPGFQVGLPGPSGLM